MLSFEAPPPGLDLNNQQQQQQQQQQQSLLGDAQEFAFMQATEGDTLGQPTSAEFGDEFAASEEFHQNIGSQQPSSMGNSEGMLLLNNSFLSPNYSNNRFNLSTIEQILKLSPSDLEFLDDTQLDLVSAVALASSANPAQFLQNMQQPLPLKNFSSTLSSSNQQKQYTPTTTTTTTNQTSTNKSFGTRMPKSLHNYMRRLASIYQPVQQQLASILSLQSSTPTSTASSLMQTAPPSSQQQQQQIMASLHQQILAAAALVPSTINQPNGNKQQLSGGQQNEPGASASSQSSSFSLASLVPKSKIDLSKSNLGKRFNKLRIKTGRKYEPQAQQQQAASNQANKQQPKPPTPDNEFNYDIFNNQLVQMEERQKQFQNIENFAAALAAANNNNLNWQTAPSIQQQRQQYQMGLPTFSPPTGSEAADNLIFSTAFDLAPPRHQQHFVEPLQQQQSTLNVLENFDQPQNHQGDQQQAVFIKKLPQQSSGYTQQQSQQTFPKPPGNNRWQHQNQAGARFPHQDDTTTTTTTTTTDNNNNNHHHHHHYQQQHQPSRSLPSYLDSTDYNSIRQSSLVVSQKPQVEKQHQVANNELLNGSDGTNHYLIRQQDSGEQTSGLSNTSDMDHMLAIERYSKQSSERRPPSIVHPVTGEQVYTSTDGDYSNHTKHLQQQKQPVRFSSKLIDKHVVEPTTGGDNFQGGVATTTTTTTTSPTATLTRNQQLIAPHTEILDTEQSVQATDLRRLNGSEQDTLYSSSSGQIKLQRQQQPTTTELPAVLLRPASSIDFFASEPPATTTMAYSTPSPTSQTGPTSGPLVPSIRSPQTSLQQQQQQRQQQSQMSTAGGDTELVLKTNLIEPIKSTLVPTTSPSIQFQSQQPIFNLDTSPFTPIEFVSGTFNQRHRLQQQQQQQIASATSNLLAFHLRPPAFVESMLNQYRSPFRPEPPVRVASYLAQQLVGINGGGQQPSISPDIAGGSTKSKTSQEGYGSTSTQASQVDSSKAQSAGLIILKPTMLTNHAAKTYALRPEYLTTSSGNGHNQQDQAFRPQLNGGKNQADELHQAAAGELLYRPASGGESSSMTGSRQLAGHQFDRLSSLSSPPSTSMILDPMQVSTSMQTYNFQFNEQQRQQRQLESAHSSDFVNNQEQDRVVEKLVNSTKGEQHLYQQQPRHMVSRLQPDHLDQGSVVPNRTQPTVAEPELNTQLEFNILQRDNNTDNAILSHVMSLISSNAIPTPPLVPLVSAYSSADYLLPVSDHAHHHKRRQVIRAGRSLKRIRRQSST